MRRWIRVVVSLAVAGALMAPGVSRGAIVSVGGVWGAGRLGDGRLLVVSVTTKAGGTGVVTLSKGASVLRIIVTCAAFADPYVPFPGPTLAGVQADAPFPVPTLAGHGKGSDGKTYYFSFPGNPPPIYPPQPLVPGWWTGNIVRISTQPSSGLCHGRYVKPALHINGWLIGLIR